MTPWAVKAIKTPQNLEVFDVKVFLHSTRRYSGCAFWGVDWGVILIPIAASRWTSWRILEENFQWLSTILYHGRFWVKLYTKLLLCTICTENLVLIDDIWSCICDKHMYIYIYVIIHIICMRPAVGTLGEVSCRVVKDHWLHGSAATHALKRPNGHHHPATSLSPSPLRGGQNHFPLLPGRDA